MPNIEYRCFKCFKITEVLYKSAKNIPDTIQCSCGKIAYKIVSQISKPIFKNNA